MKEWEKPQRAVVSTKGQVVIPEPLRTRYKIEKGTQVNFFAQGDNIILHPITRDSIEKLRGILGTRGKLLKTLLEERKKDLQREEAKWKHLFRK